MSDTPRIETPHVRIVYGDGRSVTVRTENPDMVFYDMERAKRKWPAGQDAPMLWINYLAFSKLRRAGDIDRGLSFDDWLMTTSAIENLDDDDQPSANMVMADPTRPGHVPG